MKTKIFLIIALIAIILLIYFGYKSLVITKSANIFTHLEASYLSFTETKSFRTMIPEGSGETTIEVEILRKLEGDKSLLKPGDKIFYTVQHYTSPPPQELNFIKNLKLGEKVEIIGKQVSDNSVIGSVEDIRYTPSFKTTRVSAFVNVINPQNFTCYGKSAIGVKKISQGYEREYCQFSDAKHINGTTTFRTKVMVLKILQDNEAPLKDNEVIDADFIFYESGSYLGPFYLINDANITHGWYENGLIIIDGTFGVDFLNIYNCRNRNVTQIECWYIYRYLENKDGCTVDYCNSFTGKHEFCEDLQDQSLKERCYHEPVSICSELPTQENKDDCYSYFASDTSFCKNIFDEEKNADCYTKFAINNADGEICYNIKDIKLQNHCFWVVVIDGKWNDLTCKPHTTFVENEENRNKCIDKYKPYCYKTEGFIWPEKSTEDCLRDLWVHYCYDLIGYEKTRCVDRVGYSES